MLRAQPRNSRKALSHAGLAASILLNSFTTLTARTAARSLPRAESAGGITEGGDAGRDSRLEWEQEGAREAASDAGALAEPLFPPRGVVTLQALFATMVCNSPCLLTMPTVGMIMSRGSLLKLATPLGFRER